MRIIKKYPNRRLYDTEKSSYITLAAVYQLIREGLDFKVVDAESGEDITRSILIQIIIEQENGESPIFTTEMLTKFIGFYDDAAKNLFGEFLEKNLQIFTEHQKRYMAGMMDNPMSRVMQDMTERNLDFWKGMQQRFFDLATTGMRPAGKPEEASDAEADLKKKRQ
ncbi:MAG TPA: polyhydroxyalkanoate synthesis repressor PhaR [Alphaproteobacteria bacterium]|nr:polyhydroxyalkanoate synthesis repressor PhaR [Rhodospirillaceae bacterium]HRJ67570.1 polyhydroxyalkanoate synthesis repressor PhaR [Alphaproteobacteria bacterium]